MLLKAALKDSQDTLMATMMLQMTPVLRLQKSRVVLGLKIPTLRHEELRFVHVTVVLYRADRYRIQPLTTRSQITLSFSFSVSFSQIKAFFKK